MRTAYLNLRHLNDSRSEIFHAGLSRLGYRVERRIPDRPPKYGDVFVTWNRIGMADKAARRFSREGERVIVAENATWGNTFAGEKWYHMSPGYHNTADRSRYGGPERFDRLGVELHPLRPCKGGTVILLQRGIGSDPVRMPRGFAAIARKDYHGARIRKHPGKFKATPLEVDLAAAYRVVNWGSGAAVKAAILGLEVVSYMPNWIGAHEHTEAARLDMIRRLAWAQWTHREIESGEAFKWLIP